MAKIRKGTTVVLKLDDLFLWIRKQKQHKNRVNDDIQNNDKNNKKDRFKIVNRPCDFNKLPPCRAKIIYMGIPKFLKTKRVIFGVQLYPPYVHNFTFNSSILPYAFLQILWFIQTCLQISKSTKDFGQNTIQRI